MGIENGNGIMTQDSARQVQYSFVLQVLLGKHPSKRDEDVKLRLEKHVLRIYTRI